MNWLRNFMVEHPVTSMVVLLPFTLLLSFSILAILLQVILPVALAFLLAGWIVSWIRGRSWISYMLDPFWYIKHRAQ